MASINKPTVLPRWSRAEATPSTPGANETEPGSAQKTSGWNTNQIPPSDFENWRAGQNFNWWAWIDNRVKNTANPFTAIFAMPGTTRITEGQTQYPATSPTSWGTASFEAVAPNALRKGGIDNLTADPAGGMQFTAATATFITDNVAIGDFVRITGSTSDDGDYIVSSVDSETQLSVRYLSGRQVPNLTGGGIAGTIEVRGPGQAIAMASSGLMIQRHPVSNFIRIKPNEAGSDLTGYTMTFPAALPVSGDRLISIDDTGVVSFGGNTLERIVVIGDGVSTFGDFEGTDETPFVNAIADVVANGGYIRVLEGTYTFTSSVTLPDGSDQIVIIGDSVSSVGFPGAGVGRPVIASDGVITDLFNGGFGGTETHSAKFVGIEFNLAGAATKLIDMQPAAQASAVEFERCQIDESNGATAVIISYDDGLLKLKDCNFDAPFGEIDFSPTDTAPRLEMMDCTGFLQTLRVTDSQTGCFIDRCALLGSGADMIVIDGDARQVSFRDTNIQRIDEGRVVYLNNTTPAGSQPFVSSFSQCSIVCIADNAAGPAFNLIDVIGDGTHTIESCFLRLADDNSAAQRNHIEITNASYVNILNNTFSNTDKQLSSTSNPIRLTYTGSRVAGVSVVGNSLSGQLVSQSHVSMFVDVNAGAGNLQGILCTGNRFVAIELDDNSSGLTISNNMFRGNILAEFAGFTVSGTVDAKQNFGQMGQGNQIWDGVSAHIDLVVGMFNGRF